MKKLLPKTKPQAMDITGKELYYRWEPTVTREEK